MKKKKLYMAAAAACIAAIGIGSAAAYMTEKEEVTNVFTVGALEVGLQETEWDPDDEDGINMYPGYTAYKNPTVKNITNDENGEEPCYVRMSIHILDEDGNPVSDQHAVDLIKQTIRFDPTYTGNYEEKGIGSELVQNRIPGYALEELENIPMVNPDFTFDPVRSEFNTLVYHYMGTDGTGILNIGEEAALFTAIVIPTDWNQTHFSSIGDFQIKVSAEAIQASGFSSQNDAFLALDQEIAAGSVQTSHTDDENQPEEPDDAFDHADDVDADGKKADKN